MKHGPGWRDESMTLWKRRMNYESAQSWKTLLEHPMMTLVHPRAVRDIKKNIRSVRNPPLIHKGRKA